MKVDVAKKWANELRTTRSGQTTGRLRETVEDCPHPAFCVLGVLCDLYLREKGEQWQEKVAHDPSTGEVLETRWLCGDSPDSIPPLAVLKWAGLRCDSQINVYPALSPQAQHDCEGTLCYANFTEANDEYGVTFEQFADLIESQATRL